MGVLTHPILIQAVAYIAVALITMVLSDATINHDGGVVYPPSEITAQTPIIQNDLRNNNMQGLSYLPPPPLPQFSSYHPPPVVPPVHSSSILESNSAWNDDTTINHFSLSSMPVLPPPHLSHYHPLPVVPPFKSSSVLETINTSTSSPQNEPEPSSMQVLPPALHSHHPTQVLPPPLRPEQSPPPITPPFYASKDQTGRPSTSNSNPSSTHTPTTVDHSYHYYRNHQPDIRSFHPPSGVVQSMNSFASTHSRATSKVKSAAVIYQTTPPTTMSPFHTPGVVDPSTYSEASSLTSSHQTTGTSSAVNYTSDSKTSSLQTLNDQHLITTNDSNLSSHDMIGIINGKPPDMLFLPNDFLPAKKKLIDERHGYKIWTYAVHFDRSLPDKNPDGVQMQSFLNKIMHFYEDIYDNLTKCLLSHLMVGCDILYLMVVSRYPHCYSLLFTQQRPGQIFTIFM